MLLYLRLSDWQAEHVFHTCRVDAQKVRTAAPAVDAGTLLRGYEWVGRRVKLPALALF